MDKFRLLLRRCMYILFIAGLISCSPPKKESIDVKIIPVRLQEIMYSDNVYQQEYVGIVEGENSVNISFQVNGNIEQIYAQEGQSVHNGELLAKLNTSSIKSMYNAAKATLNQAQDAYDRLAILHNGNSLPEIKYIEAKTALEQAQASERIAYKNLQDCNLYAPFSGVISRRFQESGANVMPGAPIYNLVTINSVKIKVAIPENEISAIKVGEPCRVKISALENKSFEAKVVEKGISANPISHTYDIKVRVDNTDLRIMPGMVCKAYLINNRTTADKRNIIVPLKAVQVDYSGKHFVWIKDEQNKAVYREISQGKLMGNGIVIEQGLQEGDKLIIEGYQNISPGTTVEVVK
ncbi:MAG: efflux RND transporter periplasmic adaptor subunit [Massilibacteroides sp.]|nr:efflux RND transporter periplasmic adaptor subunit [Massilibacteroides sp.]MDD3061875.1 efflux RND transporter periplasmic adaptor subunit [Massilibacteroides sp.]MDD4115147.1 efflux RND transporter periplasmic adaptor subunit [Massilibacteroides sp.]MDD4661248.1 efflux RND transporter periplasmic adaptor subunit [Massilibacteroides sp.]